jgi:hypothetical protein
MLTMPIPKPIRKASTLASTSLRAGRSNQHPVSSTDMVTTAAEVFAENPGSAAPVTQKPERGATITAVKTEQGWTLVARRGKLLGYVASDKIDPSIGQGITAGRVARVEP